MLDDFYLNILSLHLDFSLMCMRFLCRYGYTSAAIECDVLVCVWYSLTSLKIYKRSHRPFDLLQAAIRSFVSFSFYAQRRRIDFHLKSFSYHESILSYFIIPPLLFQKFPYHYGYAFYTATLEYSNTRFAFIRNRLYYLVDGFYSLFGHLLLHCRLKWHPAAG